ncbi:MAG: hypothetical protein ACREFS_11580 [Acetobacteraceae bacterium]
MAVQFTPPSDIDEQDEIDRLHASLRAGTDLREDAATQDWRARQRLGRLAFKWFFIRVVFWLPLLATVSLPAAWLAFEFTVAAYGKNAGGGPWLVAVCIGLSVCGYVIRDVLGGIAAFRGPLRVRAGGAPRNLLEAAAGGIWNGLASIYCFYVVFFYGVGIIVITGLLSPVRPPPVG